MAWVLYDNFKLGQEDGNNIDLNTDVLKMALLKPAYTPAAATHTLWGDAGVSTNEVTGTGYTAGGDTLSAPTATLATGTVTFDVPDNTWSQNAAGFADARYVVIYASVSGRLIAYHDMTTDQTMVSGDFTVQIDALGVFTKT